MVGGAPLDGAALAVRAVRLPADDHPAPCRRAVDRSRCSIARPSSCRWAWRWSCSSPRGRRSACRRCFDCRCALLAVLLAAAFNTTFDLMFQAWIADHFVDAWRTLPADFSRGYASTLNYILVFGVNMILFHVNYVRRAGDRPGAADRRGQQRRAAGAAGGAALPAQSAFPVQLAELDLGLDRHRPQQGRRGDDRPAVELPAQLAERRSGRAHPARGRAGADRGISGDRKRPLRRPAQRQRRLPQRRLPGAWCPASWSSRWSRMRSSTASPARARRSRSRSTPRCGTARSESASPTASTSQRASRAARQQGAGVGLANVEHRLQAVFGKRASLTAGPAGNQFVATIRIPEIKLAN